MAVLINAIAAVLFLGLLGGMLGAMVGLVLIPHPVDACGMWWLVALVEGAMYGLTGGATLGVLLGLVC
jgi:hypothetical protein